MPVAARSLSSRKGVPAEGWLIQDSIDNYEGKRHSFYAGDTISAGRMTFNVGLRYDNQTSQGLPSAVPAHSSAPDLFPANSFAGSEKGTWNSLSPRLGITYDLTGDSKTILRLSAARYYSQMGAWEYQRLNTTSGREMDFEWTDLNGNGQIDTGETGDLLWVSGGWDPDNPTADSPNIVDETSAPWTNELIVGIERELNRSFAVGGNFIYKKNSNFTWNPRRGKNRTRSGLRQRTPLERSFYEPVGPRSISNHYQQRNGYNTQYTGVELFLNKRFADKWMGNASFTWASPTQNYTDVDRLHRSDQHRRRPGRSDQRSRFADRVVLGSQPLVLEDVRHVRPARRVQRVGFFQVREGNIIAPTIRTNNRANTVRVASR